MPPSQLSVPDDLSLTSDGQTLLTLKGTSTPPAAIVFAPSTAVTDGDLSPNTIAPSIDQTAHALRIRAEYSDTTLRTAVIPFQPNATLTVGPSGADFTSIQAAWNHLKSRLLQSAVTIAVEAGIYTEAVTLNEQPFSNLITIQGDTRTAAGQHFVTTGSITKSGNNCTITLTSTPPSDFTASDHVIIGGASTAANVGRFPIVLINTGSKMVTYVNAAGVAEAVLVNTELIFCPNRILNFTRPRQWLHERLPGAGDGDGIHAVVHDGRRDGRVGAWRRGIVRQPLRGVRGQRFRISGPGWRKSEAGYAVPRSNVSAGSSRRATAICWPMARYAGGHRIDRVDRILLDRIRIPEREQRRHDEERVRLLTQDCGTLYLVNGATSHHTQFGILATNNGVAYVDGCKARNNPTAYGASWNGLTVATNTSANNSGNTTDYSPPTSGTPANIDGSDQLA